MVGKNRKNNAADTPGKPEKKSETPMEFIASMALVLVVGLFIITFNLQAFEIPSSSMENTLLIGDHVFVDRVTLAPKTNWVGPVIRYREPRHGDIVVFLSPAEPGLYVVKRIIGIPGDHIRLRDGAVFRNGQQLDEPYVIHNGSYNPYRDNFPNVVAPEGMITPEWRLSVSSYTKDGELVVPPERYFAMGDNRDVSYDSRYWGFIPQENIVGRPMFIYWSFETPAGQYLKTSFEDRLAFIGKVIFHFFDETRWRRMFHLVR
ncbi:MAG TPA: signal peptidase I [Terriglobales bacterium]|nr:signal peptidase I [Terriglobales bacterium]